MARRVFEGKASPGPTPGVDAASSGAIHLTSPIARLNWDGQHKYGLSCLIGTTRDRAVVQQGNLSCDVKPQTSPFRRCIAASRTTLEK